MWGRAGLAVAWGLSRVTGLVPWSVAEVLILLVLALFLTLLVRGVADVARGRRRLVNLLAGGALLGAQVTGLIVGGFYLLWGFGYSRPRLEERFDWPSGAAASPSELEGLAREMLDATNHAYRDVHGTDDALAPTALDHPAVLEPALEEGWRRAARAAGLGGLPERGEYGRIKRPLVLSLALDWLGISGFYLPFTGEANVNRGLPAASYPMTAAHEKAHQRGFNPENEANFFGFLAAVNSPDPLARYSALLFAQRQLLTALATLDEERVGLLLRQRLPGVQRDVDDIRDYWARFEGPAREASRRTNDAFLRTNRVEGGVASYGRSVELLVAWARERGGTLAP
ncbi:MAG: DUF3810 domain-containing protein [Candidatus Eiseniibacteriota bacterium]